MSEESNPQILLAHAGELTEIPPLLGRLGLPFLEAHPPLSEVDATKPWDLVIGTPPHLLSLVLKNPARGGAEWIAMIDRESGTLRASLDRAGVRLRVRRPVHPAALRALILHTLYRGPEKRRCPRASIGAPVRIRVGWRSRRVILRDLSLGGCGVLVARPLEAGQAFRVTIPTEVSDGRGFTLKARVLETRLDTAVGAYPHLTSARFEGLNPTQHNRLKAVILSHREGPARYAAAELAADLRGAEDAQAPRPAPGADAKRPATDRRQSSRHRLEEEFVALDEEADRVLMGRDISTGGMRVQPNPHLVVGMNLRLAIHVNDRDEPLEVKARVHRDDGKRGLMLRFHALEPEVSRYLNHMMDQLPVVEDDKETLIAEVLR